MIYFYFFLIIFFAIRGPKIIIVLALHYDLDLIAADRMMEQFWTWYEWQVFKIQ